jgi:NAD(P)-dependent dehydrogenase (short-subunit alcohol dehydrogenase family)
MGLAHARTLHARGAAVVITDVDGEGLGRARDAFPHPERVLPVVADNRDVAQLEAAVARARETFGPIDVLVNNAGISGRGLAIEAIGEGDFDAMLGTHLKGAFFLARAVVPEMKAKARGRIINISSHFAAIGSASASHYTIAKAALNGMTRTLARELAPWRITVNTVAPALVETAMTLGSIGGAEIARRAEDYPLGRIADAEEVSFAVAWLASDEAAMVTGQVISPHGGIAIVGL